MNSIELWPGGPELFESRAAQPLSTDSVLLADFVRPSGSALGLDLGSGSGVLSVILMHRLPSLKMALCEIDPGAAELSRENLELNGFSSRASVWAEDMRGLKESKVGRFDFIITNPPYFPLSGGRSPDSARDLRRVEVNCSLSELCAVSAALLGQNGRFYIVYPASRMAELVCRLSEARLEPKRLRLVQARADAAPSLVLIEAAKLGKPGVIVEPALILRNPDGTDTEETKKIYHKGDKIMSGTLYLVGTPIGNLGDLSPRAVEILASADFIAAEDTRVSLKLLNHFGIKKPLVSYYEHNKSESGQRLLERLLSGESCALVTDAGMPAISDPGEDIVKLCAENGVTVSVIPGPCAAPSALAVSGLPTGRFTFEGFLPVDNKERRARLSSLSGEKRTMIFYEAPHKLKKTLSDLSEAFGADRRISLVRELTKIHEEVIRVTLGKAALLYADAEPRGEFVLVVEGAKEDGAPEISLDEAVNLVLAECEKGVPLKLAAKEISARCGIGKSVLYNEAVKRR